MPIFVAGVNHKSAPIALLEKVMFASDKLSLYLNDLNTQENMSEAVILSTCNRSEIYCNTVGPEKMIAWFCRQHQISRQSLESYIYYYQDLAAVRHIMNVAAGLDSMVLGESQILAQMKQAYSESVAAGCIGPLFNRLFQQVFAVTKEVRTNTAIGACPVSVSSAAVQFIKETITPTLHEKNLLLIGAGITIELVLRHLKENLPKRLLMANRHIDNVKRLINSDAAEIVSLEALPRVLVDADIVVTATGASLPIITNDLIHPREKPLWIVDIAVPRDVAPTVSALPQVHLFSIDDLKTIIQNNLKSRQHAAEKAEEVIQQKSLEFMTWLQSLDLVAITIRAYRKQIEDLCHVELTKAMKQLHGGADPSWVLSTFAATLTKKLLHHPSVQLRQAGYEGRLEFLQLVQQFFAISEPKIAESV